MTRTCGFMHVHHHAVAQEVGYPEVRRQIESAKASSRLSLLSGVTRIPVVVHVVYHDDAQNVSDAQVREQIAVLNADFRARNEDIDRVPEPFRPLIADTRIEFALARRDPAGRPTSGIVRTKTSVPRFPAATVPAGAPRSPYIDREVKLGATGSVAWPRDQYLNLWVCDMGMNPLGYAAFPGSAAWRDGVVVDTSCFGRSGTVRPPFNGGRTAVHEVGHWLDLLHIWGDDDGLCTRSDSVGDTPNQAGPNYNEPQFPQVTCNNGPHGDLFMNFMDYVDDAAMVMFTAGQMARMHAALRGPRASLLSSPGLDDPDPIVEDAPVLKSLASFASVGGAKPVEEVFDGVQWVSVDLGVPVP